MTEKNAPEVVSINISEKKGEIKNPVESAVLLPEHGIEGDAHAGSWHRQVSLLALESIEKMAAAGISGLVPGSFAENVTTKGIELHTLPIGTRLAIGKCLLEVTQIGKECHNRCAIFEKAGACVMPAEGIFARVITGGNVSKGDIVEVVR